MEPRGLVAEWQDGRLTLFGAAKVPFPNRRILAQTARAPGRRHPPSRKRRRRRLGVRGEFYPEDS